MLVELHRKKYFRYPTFLKLKSYDIFIYPAKVFKLKSIFKSHWGDKIKSEIFDVIIDNNRGMAHSLSHQYAHCS